MIPLDNHYTRRQPAPETVTTMSGKVTKTATGQWTVVIDGAELDTRHKTQKDAQDALHAMLAEHAQDVQSGRTARATTVPAPDGNGTPLDAPPANVAPSNDTPAPTYTVVSTANGAKTVLSQHKRAWSAHGAIDGVDTGLRAAAKALADSGYKMTGNSGSKSAYVATCDGKPTVTLHVEKDCERFTLVRAGYGHARGTANGNSRASTSKDPVVKAAAEVAANTAEVVRTHVAAYVASIAATVDPCEDPSGMAYAPVSVDVPVDVLCAVARDKWAQGALQAAIDAAKARAESASIPALKRAVKAAEEIVAKCNAAVVTAAIAGTDVTAAVEAARAAIDALRCANERVVLATAKPANCTQADTTDAGTDAGELA